ncbi:hypothetical protein [Flavilitoribacter nigricans]|uniref:Tetratricopeptide repeat protein n=1 Tax=Flavilitoribacter nigricans (strain ATCC 23147 / DSM 23189 / NBRC 102662 / NCIMB 1420 / SS-2) TaxID=1122177 RepID=A0A2D0N8H0_FLAN2|nr:hypothetical protein [Flavilitoribacter nigricans]PHN04812.1 hypothetical protein CRP01_20085 [Flavilitoribacter nigricans DSM 23189 = NBRC 102662]
MKSRKLIQFIQSCDTDELVEFEKFLASPFYNEDPEVRQLFKILRPHYPDFSGAGLNKHAIYRAVYGDQAYNDKRLRYLFSDLTKLIETFFAVQKIRSQPHQLQLALLDSLSGRGLPKGFRRVNRQLKRELEDGGQRSSDVFFTKMQWSEIRERHFQKKRIRKFDLSLQHFANDLDQYYFLNRLKIVCAMLDRQTIFQDEYDLNISSGWLQHLEQNQFYGSVLIQIYYTIFQALRDESEESHFTALVTFLRQPGLSVADIDLRDIYLFAINYCARKIRQGKEKYVAEALQLYRDGIEKGPLLNERGISPWAFTNVVKLALRRQEYHWIGSFIHRYAPLLPEQFRENALHYNLAELYYYTDRFDQAQEHLIRVEFSDLNYYLGARVLLAKIYYESGEEEALLSLISSFTVFLKRNKELSANLKRTYLNFCQILFQIVRRAPSQMKKLQASIDNSELLTDRAWLQKIYSEAMGK